MRDPFGRYGALIVRLRWVVLIVWIVILGVAGALFAPKASSVTKGGGFDVPGSQSAEATTILERDFGESTQNNAVVVFHSDNTTVQDPTYQKQVTDAATRLASVSGVLSVFTFYNTQSSTFVSPDQHTTFAIVSLSGSADDAQKRVPDLDAQLKSVTIDHYLTGYPAINEDTFTTSEKDLRRSELFTLPIALILLLLVFRTVFAAAVPLVLGAASVVASLSILYFVGMHISTSIFALNVASMIGLGLGIDFSLLTVNRFREERAAGRQNNDAVVYTMMTAGRSITYSGLTVILSMGVLTMLLHDLMIIRSISIGVMIVAAVSLLAGLTLLPALLAILGHRIEWLRVMPRPKPKTSHQGGFWYRLSHTIMAHPWPWLIGALIILIGLALPFLGLKVVGATTGVLPPKTESVVGEQTLKNAFADNRLTPIQIVIDTKQKNGVWNSDFLNALDQLTNAIKFDVRVKDVQSIATYLALVPRDGRYGEVNANYFTPAPKIDPTTGQPDVPGVKLDTVIEAEVDKLPPAPAFLGIGRFTIAPGQSTQPNNVPGYELMLIESGSLQVKTTSQASVTRAGNIGDFTKAEAVPDNGMITLNKGDQLSIPPSTTTSFQNTTGAPAQFLSASIFVIRPGIQDETTWTEGTPSSDLFVGLQRRVLSGAVASEMPPGKSIVHLYLATLQPGGILQRHVDPGPELITGVSGTLTIYSSPEMTATKADGTPYVEDFDSPLAITNGAKAFVQAFGIRRAVNLGTVPAVAYALDVTDASLPGVIPIAVTESADQFVNLSGDSSKAVITIIPKTGEYDAPHQQLVYDLRDSIIPSFTEFKGDSVYVGGDSAGLLDLRDTLYHRFPYIIVSLAVMIFVILMMFFQSVILPIKAIFLNLMSILATYGVLVLIFQHGYGTSLLGFKSQGALNVITPAVLYVILFALSTDYEVFMLSRVKEFYHETGNNEEAVAAGLQSTAGVITAAGLILVGTFGSFATAEVVTIKEIGIGLAVGVLIDSTLVRVIMVPATMRLLGAKNWWMPEWLRRIVPELSEGPAVPSLIGAPAHSLSGSGVIYAMESAPVEAIVGAPGNGSVAGADRPRRFAPPPAAQLRPIDGTLNLELIPLSATRPLTIGREERNDLQLFDGRVSRFHARIDYADGQYSIVDLNSSNGVYVNGNRLDAEPDRKALRTGDEIEIGTMGAFRFVFEIRPDR